MLPRHVLGATDAIARVRSLVSIAQAATAAAATTTAAGRSPPPPLIATAHLAPHEDRDAKTRLTLGLGETLEPPAATLLGSSPSLELLAIERRFAPPPPLSPPPFHTNFAPQRASAVVAMLSWLLAAAGRASSPPPPLPPSWSSALKSAGQKAAVAADGEMKRAVAARPVDDGKRTKPNRVDLRRRSNEASQP